MHVALNKQDNYFLPIRIFSIYGMEECNVKCYDLLILFEKIMIHVAAIGSVKQLICYVSHLPLE